MPPVHYYFDKDMFELKFMGFITKELHLNGSEFCKQLRTNNCFVSGSCLLSVMYDQNVHGDVNVFYNVEPYEEYFKQFGYHLNIQKTKMDIEQTRSFFERYLIDFDYEITNTVTEHQAFKVEYIRTYRRKGIPTAIVFMRTALLLEPQKIVTDKFDISLCMNYYDGKTLYIHNKQDIIDKKFTIIFRKEHHKSVPTKRAKKYIKKGFEEACRIDETYKTDEKEIIAV